MGGLMFDFWYEGTSSTASGYGSSTMSHDGHAGSSKTASRQILSLASDLPSIHCPTAKYFHRTVVTSVVGVNNYVIKSFPVEDVRTLAGKTVTLSFYAKADTVRNIAIEYWQGMGSGGSPSSDVSTPAGLISISSAWNRYSITTIIPSLSGKTIGTDGSDRLGINFWFDAGSTFTTRTSNLGRQSGTFDIACVQLEEGTVATPFEELPIEVSQKRIERYYEEGMYDNYMGYNYNTTGYISGPILYRTVKRSTPVIHFWGDSIRGTLQSNVQLTDGPAYSSNTLISGRSDSTLLHVIHTGEADARTMLRFYYVADARL